MRVINSFVNRILTATLAFLQKFLTPKNQLVFSGPDSCVPLCQHIGRLKHQRVLLITDKILVDLGLAQKIVSASESAGVEVVVYDGVLPDPTTTMVNEALNLCEQHRCSAIIALGGGSSIDTGKGVSAAATNGDIRKLVGILKVKNAPLPLFAIPTTSGTGSEVSIAAVISDSETHKKGVMGDPSIAPQAVALDPTLQTGLPPAVTAATAMDALSHAIETYVSRWSDDTSRSYSSTAIKLIFENLPVAYTDGADIGAREALCLASYYAGNSLNKGSVGNIHALAHQLGSQYSIPHGSAIAMVMPRVLRMSLNKMKSNLAQLALDIGVGSSSCGDTHNAERFIGALEKLQQQVGIDNTSELIQQQHVAAMASEAIKEALVYPTPHFMSRQQAEAVYQQLMA